MACIIPFCDRLDAVPGDHACELPPQHAEACRCECEGCLEVAATAVPADRPVGQPASLPA